MKRERFFGQGGRVWLDLSAGPLVPGHEGVEGVFTDRVEIADVGGRDMFYLWHNGAGSCYGEHFPQYEGKAGDNPQPGDVFTVDGELNFRNVSAEARERAKRLPSVSDKKMQRRGVKVLDALHEALRVGHDDVVECRV